MVDNALPRTVIVEEPAPRSLRFRYRCEGRSAGSIPGVNSTSEVKTFPSIRVEGYNGPAKVLVSLVSKNSPYQPHPHNLVGKNAKHGVLNHDFIADSNSKVVFNSLGIQCVRRNEIKESLQERQSYQIDPFNTGYGHLQNLKNINLNVVRLCFQVFLPNEVGVCRRPLRPEVSDPIYDIKSKTDLIIFKLSDNSSSVIGGKQIILLCEKVVKTNIKVRFYEEIDGKIEWEAFGEFTEIDVFRQVAITFKTPPYKTIDICEPVCVFVQLQRNPDKMTSEPFPFFYTPDDAAMLKRKKRQKVDNFHPESFKYIPDAMLTREAADAEADYSCQIMNEIRRLTINMANTSTIGIASTSKVCGGHQSTSTMPQISVINETEGSRAFGGHQTIPVTMNETGGSTIFGGHQSTPIVSPIYETGGSTIFGGSQSTSIVLPTSETINQTSDGSTIFYGHENTYTKEPICETIFETGGSRAFGGHQSTSTMPPFGGHQSTSIMPPISEDMNETDGSTHINCGATMIAASTATDLIEMNSSSNLNSLDELKSDELHPLIDSDELRLTLSLLNETYAENQNQMIATPTAPTNNDGNNGDRNGNDLGIFDNFTRYG